MEYVPVLALFPGMGVAGTFVQRPQACERRFPLAPNAVLLARLHSRTRLTTMDWHGDQDKALLIIDELMDNAIEDVEPQLPAEEIGLALSVDGEEALLISVADPSPAFPNFEEARAAEDKGFALVLCLGGELSWFISEDGMTKTVQALISYRPTPGDTH
ncbi:sensor histidine kinase [Streptomyces sp. BH-SS-21]|uniref:Sensor histidine kinase n=1 Tax=Streptomyces liliiviolaceus TaxID=2823109 RepID=A0A940Y563_9ACTN|nr:ATP-binding protein [Streptomyces liliiviolaceus]MBQ0855440.1 sensor histidine kinase [Streptomyces liliiviolaceus]